MSFFRCAALATIAIFTLLFSSCIDGREEVWLNADGSGRADLVYEIPAAAARMKGGPDGIRKLLAELLKDTPGGTHEVVPDGDRIKIRVKLDFKSPDDLRSMTSPQAEMKLPTSFEYLAGTFDVRRSLRTVDFTRTIFPGKALPTVLIPPAELKGRKLTYILHLPIAPTESTASRRENDGRTLIWERPLAGDLRQPIVIHFKAKIPIPLWLMISAAAGILLLFVGIGLAISKKRQRAGTSLR